MSKIPLGGEIRVLIGGKPFFVRHRTAAEIAAADSVNVATLRDPETDDARLRPKADGALNPAILVTSGSCTHLGCVPVGPAQGNTGDFGGWYCPCHGSHYDTSGRLRKGVEARGVALEEVIGRTQNISGMISSSLKTFEH